MKKPYMAMALAAITMLSAACSFQEPNLVTGLPYPSQTVKLEIVNATEMTNDEINEFRSVLIEALKERNIQVHNPSNQTLIVEVTAYNRESQLRRAGKVALSVIPGGPWTNYTTNALDLKVSLKKGDNTVIRFQKFEEIKESARDFNKLRRSMTRRVADEVLGATESS
ncbi:MAG: hypothetical protein C4576_04905 [Desulfobacteraceae bacterium]|nr:MAG: hypothetical protein C4576_04905 [Desulfobacteraceae bacterium]